MSPLESHLNQIRTARLYTMDLLTHTDDNDWYRQPAEGVTNIAWQVGHLAVAQYGLALKRLRGERTEDPELISVDFLKKFGKGSVPSADRAVSPGPEEIRAVFNRVHQQVLEEVAVIEEDILRQPADGPPHPMFSTKLGALRWCGQHEFIHAGQIALLRRLFGGDPLR